MNKPWPDPPAVVCASWIMFPLKDLRSSCGNGIGSPSWEPSNRFLVFCLPAQTTHRLLNRLWTRTYRNSNGQKKGQALPMEEEVVLLVSRATSQEFELLSEWVRQVRPDVSVLYVSSRAVSMSQPLLRAYRHRLCKAGFGPYKVRREERKGDFGDSRCLRSRRRCRSRV